MLLHNGHAFSTSVQCMHCAGIVCTCWHAPADAAQSNNISAQHCGMHGAQLYIGLLHCRSSGSEPFATPFVIQGGPAKGGFLSPPSDSFAVHKGTVCHSSSDRQL